MIKSIPAIVTLSRHLLIIAEVGVPVRKREILEAVSQRFGLDPTPFHTILGIREGTTKPSDVHSLFASYLDQVQKLTDAQTRPGQ